MRSWTICCGLIAMPARNLLVLTNGNPKTLKDIAIRKFAKYFRAGVVAAPRGSIKGVILGAFEKVILYKALCHFLGEGPQGEGPLARPVAFPKSLKRRKTRLASFSPGLVWPSV
jgi:hypothetical protein